MQRSYYNIYIPFGQIKRLKEILNQEESLNVYITPFLKYKVENHDKVEARLEINISGENHRQNIETLIKIHGGQIISCHKVGQLAIREKLRMFFRKYMPVLLLVYMSGVTTSLINRWDDIYKSADYGEVTSILLLKILVAVSAVVIVKTYSK